MTPHYLNRMPFIGWRILVLTSVLFLISSCAGKQASIKQTPIQDLKAPEWVKKGSGAYQKDQGKFFYGVASASGIQNTSLLRTTAEDRARNEVAKIFQVYTASLMKDYIASTSAGDPHRTAEEQHVEQAVKTVTSMTLSGVQVIDYWQNPKTGELYALAKLDLAAFKDNLNQMRDLDSKVRDFVRENAERLHDQLEKEEEKQQTRQ